MPIRKRNDKKTFVICQYNHGVGCNKPCPCETCGWNPVNEDLRKKRIEWSLNHPISKQRYKALFTLTAYARCIDEVKYFELHDKIIYGDYEEALKELDLLVNL